MRRLISSAGSIDCELHFRNQFDLFHPPATNFPYRRYEWRRVAWSVLREYLLRHCDLFTQHGPRNTFVYSFLHLLTRQKKKPKKIAPHALTPNV
jgi:hypothetical protein